MNYSPKSSPTNAEGIREPLAGAGVLDVAQPGKSDLSDWVELMDVVEALCPQWPAAAKGKHGGYKL